MGKEPPETLLERIAKTPHEKGAEWLHFVTNTLRMDGCYVPAAQRIVGQHGWRRLMGKGQNAIGYIKTATYREALKMGLALDRYNSTEPRVLTKDQPPTKEETDRSDELRFDFVQLKKGHVPLVIPRGTNLEDQIDQLHASSFYNIPTKTSAGTWHQGGFADDDYEPRIIPKWMQREDDEDSVDWDIVARHAVQKSRMVPALAKVLRLRFDGRTGRPSAVAAAKSKREAHDIENGWKWIDRNWRKRIAPLFRLQDPPQKVQKTAATPKKGERRFIPPAEALRRAIQGPKADVIHSGPSIENQDRLNKELQDIGLPPDVRLGWNNGRLIVTRSWAEFEIQIEADTLAEALEILRELVTEGVIDVREKEFFRTDKMFGMNQL